REFQKVRFGGIVIELCIVRMNTDARKDIFITFSHGNGFTKIVGARIACAHIEHRRNAGLPSPSHHLVPISLKRPAVNMTMGIDQDHFEGISDLCSAVIRIKNRRASLTDSESGKTRATSTSSLI